MYHYMIEVLLQLSNKPMSYSSTMKGGVDLRILYRHSTCVQNKQQQKTTTKPLPSKAYTMQSCTSALRYGTSGLPKICLHTTKVELHMTVRSAWCIRLTKSSISLVWEAERHILALDSTMVVAGKPTTTTPIFLFSSSLENNL